MRGDQTIFPSAVLCNGRSVLSLNIDRLVRRVVKASTSRAADSGFNSRFLREYFSEVSHTSNLKTDTPVTTLPGAWHYRVIVGTGWPHVNIL